MTTINKYKIFFKLLIIIVFCYFLFFNNFVKISYINERIIKNNNNNVFDLKNYKNTFTKKYITTDFVKNNKIKKEFYFDFSKFIEYGNNYKYGISIRKTNLRFLPIDNALCKNYNEDFDYLQNSEIKFNTLLLILFEYKDWYFVQTYNANGWVKKNDIAFFDTKESFISYLTNKQFLIVIDKNIIIDHIYIDMGTKINYFKKYKNHYKVIIPKRNNDGYVYFITKNITKNGLSIGYLKYNKKNLIKQAYKYLGTKYGWGGSNNGIDCSGFILNVYSSFGIKLPQDSINQQKSTGNYINISNTTHKERLKILKNTKIGSLLYFKGHIMLYLGFINNKPSIIHSVASYSNKKIMSVTINDLYIKRNNGITFIDSLLTVTNF